MAIDPRISLSRAPTINVGQRYAQALRNAQSLDLLNQQRQQAPFQNRLLELQTQLAETQTPAQIAAIEQAQSPLQQASDQLSLEQQVGLQTFQRIQPMLDSGNTIGAIAELTSIKEQFPNLSNDIDEDILALQTQPEVFKQEVNAALQQAGIGQTPKKQVAVRPFEPITDPRTGQVSVPSFDPNTGETRLTPIEGAVQLTPDQKRQQELKQFQTKEAAKSRISRSKEIKKEIGDRNRSAARSQQPLFEALRLASNPRTAEGLAAGVKTQLARVLPGIDVANESNLDSALNRLALEQLQNFKGPTTDFEFGVTQNITGSITDPREANVSRLKSLQRANWFAKREFRQFNDFIEKGGDPDSFAFDFDEDVETNKGAFSLRDLQDTAVDNNMTIEEVIAELDK